MAIKQISSYEMLQTISTIKLHLPQTPDVIDLVHTILAPEKIRVI